MSAVLQAECWVLAGMLDMLGVLELSTEALRLQVVPLQQDNSSGARQLLQAIQEELAVRECHDAIDELLREEEACQQQHESAEPLGLAGHMVLDAALQAGHGGTQQQKALPQQHAEAEFGQSQYKACPQQEETGVWQVHPTVLQQLEATVLPGQLPADSMQRDTCPEQLQHAQQEPNVMPERLHDGQMLQSSTGSSQLQGVNQKTSCVQQQPKLSPLQVAQMAFWEEQARLCKARQAIVRKPKVHGRPISKQPAVLPPPKANRREQQQHPECEHRQHGSPATGDICRHSQVTQQQRCQQLQALAGHEASNEGQQHRDVKQLQHHQEQSDAPKQQAQHQSGPAQLALTPLESDMLPTLPDVMHPGQHALEQGVSAQEHTNAGNISLSYPVAMQQHTQEHLSDSAGSARFTADAGGQQPQGPIPGTAHQLAEPVSQHIEGCSTVAGDASDGSSLQSVHVEKSSSVQHGIKSPLDVSMLRNVQPQISLPGCQHAFDVDRVVQQPICSTPTRSSSVQWQQFTPPASVLLAAPEAAVTGNNYCTPAQQEGPPEVMDAQQDKKQAIHITDQQLDVKQLSEGQIAAEETPRAVKSAVQLQPPQSAAALTSLAGQNRLFVKAAADESVSAAEVQVSAVYNGAVGRASVHQPLQQDCWRDWDVMAGSLDETADAFGAWADGHC